jgi:Cu-processing system permease protein
MRANGSMRRVFVIAREEYRRTIESRWLFLFSILFALVVLALSFFGLAQSQEVGFQGFARVTLSLLNLSLFLVPLAALLLGVTSLSGGAESLSLLLAQPVARGEVLAGKFLGLGTALTVAQAVGFGGGGLVVAWNAGAAQAPAFLVLTLLSIALGWLSVSAALLIAAIWPDRLKAMSAALTLWLLMVVAYDLVILGATALLHGAPLQAVLLPALLINPVDLVRVLTTLAVGSGALLGPTSAVLVGFFGTVGGAALGLAVLLVETAAPLWAAGRIMHARDW